MKLHPSRGARAENRRKASSMQRRARAAQPRSAGAERRAPSEATALVDHQVGGRIWKLAARPFTIEPSAAGSHGPKGLTVLAAVVACVLIVLFGLDLALGWPFARHSVLMDVGFVICGGLLAYLSWNAYQDLR